MNHKKHWLKKQQDKHKDCSVCGHELTIRLTQRAFCPVCKERAKLDKAVEALRFYAAGESYQWDGFKKYGHACEWTGSEPILKDIGELARETLKELGE